MVYFIAILLLAFLFYRIIQGGVLFRIQVKDGQVVACSGRAPHRLRRDFKDVLRRQGVRAGVVRVVIRQQALTLLTSKEIDQGVEQMLRNVLGQFSVAELRAGPRVEKIP